MHKESSLETYSGPHLQLEHTVAHGKNLQSTWIRDPCTQMLLNSKCLDVCWSYTMGGPSVVGLPFFCLAAMLHGRKGLYNSKYLQAKLMVVYSPDD